MDFKINLIIAHIAAHHHLKKKKLSTPGVWHREAATAAKAVESRTKIWNMEGKEIRA